MRNRNKKSKGRTVLYQYLKVIKSKEPYRGEESPYWNWIFSQHDALDNEHLEHVRANPDGLSDDIDDYLERQNDQRALLETARNIMTPREKSVFDLLKLGLNQVQVSNRLKISQQTVGMTIRRIRKKIKKARCIFDDNAS